MLNKLLGAVKLSSRRLLQKKRRLPPHNRHKKGWGGGVGVGLPSLPLPLPLPLKMVLPGGVVELYYMAVPAAKIMEAHPSFMVARPEVFSRPWDSLVHPDEILNPGEKFFLVPRSTVRKLRRRIRKPPPPPNIGDLSISSSSSNISSFASQSSGTASPLINEACYSTDTETQQQGREQEHRLHKNNGNPDTDDDDDDAAAAARKRSQRRITRVKNIISWRPSLTAIRE